MRVDASQQAERWKPDIDVFQNRAFADFRKTLDAEIKCLKQTGQGSQAKQAEPLAETEEEILWEKSIIGGHSPHAGSFKCSIRLKRHLFCS